MRSFRILPLLTLAVLAAPHARAADAATKCDVSLDVTDTDPHGLNVRAAPSAQAGIVAVLKPGGDWIQVHATAQSGDWFAIDSATMMDTTLPTGEKILFHGQGFVHRSKVGGSEMKAQAVLRDKPDDKGKIILDVTGQGEVPVQVLGCTGQYYKVEVRKTVGWSKDVCLNELTTCS